MGNCVSPPAPPSIPPDHPFPGSRIHSSSHGFGFASAVSSESRPLSFGMKAGTQSDLQDRACPGKSSEKLPANAELSPFEPPAQRLRGWMPFAMREDSASLPPASSF